MSERMKENFELLERRIIDSLYDSDLNKINYELSKIEGSTLVSGVGGSSVVSEYASKVLSYKNKIITRNTEPRDFRYMDTSFYKNVLSVSYSGNNYGVDLSFSNNLNHYLLSANPNNRSDIVNITYNTSDKEKSFVSLAATLIPCSILLNYYLDNNKDRIIDDLEVYDYNFDVECDAYEIFSGYDTSVAAKYLESTMVESAIGIPIVHDKYSYCHGRSTLSINYNNNAIYFNSNTEFDRLLIEELKNYYKEVIVIDSYSYSLMRDFNLLLRCIYLTKYISENKNMDLSKVNYNPIVKKLYSYNGEI